MVDYLSHHGVKGQQWGVRNGPPYPIETGIRKGQQFSSVTALKNGKKYLKSKPNMYVYNQNDLNDKKIYEGAFALYTKQRNAVNEVYSHRYEAVKDLKMPTKKERIDEFIQQYKDVPTEMIPDLKKIQQVYKFYTDAGMLEDKNGITKINLDKLSTTSDYKKAYELFNHTMENTQAFKSANRYMKTMSSKYDAMVDDNNQGIYNGAHDPIIILNAKSNLMYVKGRSKKLKSEEINRNASELREELKKKGETMKL